MLRRERQRSDDRSSLFSAKSGIGLLLKMKDLLRLKAVDDSRISEFEFKPNGDTALLMSAHNVQAYVDAQREAVQRFHHSHKARANERDGFPTSALIINGLIEAVLYPQKIQHLCAALTAKMSGPDALDAQGSLVPLPPHIDGYQSNTGRNFIEQNRRYLEALI